MLKKFIIPAILIVAAYFMLSNTFSFDPKDVGSSTFGISNSSKIQIQSNSLENKETLFEKKLGSDSENSLTNTIVIQGKSDDSTFVKYLNPINNTYLFGKKHLDSDRKVSNSLLKLDLYNINQPLLMEFSTSDSKKNFYRAYIFVSPNDTINFEFKNEELVFTGKNAAQNNFYTELEKNTNQYAMSPYKGDIFIYKEKIKSIFKEKKRFFKKYTSLNDVSAKFISTVTKHLEFEYLNNLINPRNVKATTLDIYFNEPDVLLNLVQQESVKKDMLFNLTNYFDNISIDKFKDSTALRNSHFFKNNINAFIRNYFNSSDYPAYSKETMIEEEAFIVQNFEGDIRNYAIGRMIWDYYNKGFAYSSENIKFMVSMIDKYAETFKKDSYKEKMKDIKKDILTYDFKLSESALNAKMVNHLGDTLTLQDIFNRSKKRIKVVDFWASWCSPCVKQIQESKPFKDRLSVENNVEWIYLSIDTDREKWLKKGNDLSNYLHFRNSYLLVKGKRSPLAKALNVHQIPRYVVFDKQHRVMVNSAPSPSDETVFERIIDHTQIAAPIQ
ncbi:thioredoxin-like domain-containing protein [uncultured Kordia sp.]|uniref:TlpA family protein disulfide reductase n=1 Tax=uncultured Kordia sp. TaxID=507699 RepID=UPI00263924C4|nr:thioredoxin-like domain-containing protein [uncultured Kordia sp.]